MNLAKKHIVYVITRSEEGGAQSHVLSLIESFLDHYEITLVTGERGYLVDRVRLMGIEVRILPLLQRQVSISRDIKAVLALKKCLKALRPDLVHFHSTKAGILGRIANMGRYDTVFTAHGWVFASGSPALRIVFGVLIERLLARVTNAYITVSRADFERARQFGITPENKLNLIYNGIRIPSEPVYKSENSTANQPVKLVMVARLVAQKDHDTLLQSLEQVSVPYQLNLVGDGPNYERIHRFIEQANLHSKVNLLGTRTDIASILSEAQIFILSTNWEGLPISVLEAMSLGLPVIATDVGGVKEQVIHGQTGFLVKPKDASSLANYISLLGKNPDLGRKLGMAGYHLLQSRFNLPQKIAKTQAVYENIIANKH